VENKGEERGLVFGVDILPMHSPQSKKEAKYALVVLSNDGKVLERVQGISKMELFKRIQECRPDIIATDNVFELGANEKELIDFISSLPANTKVIQVTGSPRHGMEPLYRIAKRHGISISSKSSSLEEAEAAARLALMGIGYEVSAVEGEVKIIISRARTFGPGGWSQPRYRRYLCALVQQVTQEVEELLKKHNIDYDFYCRKTKFGFITSKFTAYTTLDVIRKLIKEPVKQDVQIKIIPVRRKHLEFIPLNSHEEESGRTKYLIIGVDPGVTTGIAILDIHGNLLEIYSAKELSRGDVIRLISKYGRPLVIATDVNPPPEFVEKLAIVFDAEIYTPPRPLTVAEKRNIAQEYLEKHVREKISLNSHERDALIAAIKAYMSIKNKLEKIEAHVKELGVKVPIEEVKRLVLRGMSIKRAIEELLSKMEKRNEQQEEETREEVDINELIAKIEELRAELRKKGKELSNLKDLLNSYKERVKQLEKENAALKESIKKLLRERILEMERDKEILVRDQMIESLINEKKRLEQQVKELNEKISKLIGLKTLETRGDVIPLKIIERFTYDSIRSVEKELGIKKGDVVLLLDASGGGASTAELLIKKGVKAVIYKTKMSHTAMQKFRENRVPVIPADKVKIDAVESFAVVNKKSLERAVREWHESIEEEESRLTHEKLISIIEEYRRGRQNSGG